MIWCSATSGDIEEISDRPALENIDEKSNKEPDDKQAKKYIMRNRPSRIGDSSQTAIEQSH